MLRQWKAHSMKSRELYSQIADEYHRMVGFVRTRLRDSADPDLKTLFSQKRLKLKLKV